MHNQILKYRFNSHFLGKPELVDFTPDPHSLSAPNLCILLGLVKTFHISSSFFSALTLLIQQREEQ